MLAAAAFLARHCRWAQNQHQRDVQCLFKSEPGGDAPHKAMMTLSLSPCWPRAVVAHQRLRVPASATHHSMLIASCIGNAERCHQILQHIGRLPQEIVALLHPPSCRLCTKPFVPALPSCRSAVASPLFPQTHLEAIHRKTLRTSDRSPAAKQTA